MFVKTRARISRRRDCDGISQLTGALERKRRWQKRELVRPATAQSLPFLPPKLAADISPAPIAARTAKL